MAVKVGNYKHEFLNFTKLYNAVSCPPSWIWRCKWHTWKANLFQISNLKTTAFCKGNWGRSLLCGIPFVHRDNCTSMNPDKKWLLWKRKQSYPGRVRLLSKLTIISKFTSEENFKHWLSICLFQNITLHAVTGLIMLRNLSLTSPVNLFGWGISQCSWDTCTYINTKTSFFGLCQQFMVTSEFMLNLSTLFWWLIWLNSILYWTARRIKTTLF